MTDIHARKSQVRSASFAARRFAHQEYSGISATDNLVAFMEPYLGQTISGYMPIRTEIDPLPAMATLAISGPVGVPVIVGDARPLEFHRWQPGCALKDGPFGAQVPIEVAQITPSVVFLPLLAFDRRGARLGYGGGYYDRTLEILRTKGPVLAVGFAYSAQEIAQVPTEATDQRLDAVVTEKYVLEF